MSDQVNILEMMGGDAGAALELVRLDSNETAIIPFTPSGERVSIHFCEETEIYGYVQCNGESCILCRVGKKKEERVLIPVYLPTIDTIGVLPVSPSLRPHALFPQLRPLLKAATLAVAFIKREGAKFTVSTRALPQDANGGEAVVKKFLGEREAGRVDLKSVYQVIGNDQLAAVAEISRLMELKGIKLS